MSRILADSALTAPFFTPEGAERRVLSYGGTMMAVEFRFGADVRAPLHQHPHEQVGYVVSGELDLFMELDGTLKTNRLHAGCSYYVPSNVRHGIYTHSACVLLDVFTPQRDEFLHTDL